MSVGELAKGVIYTEPIKTGYVYCKYMYMNICTCTCKCALYMYMHCTCTCIYTCTYSTCTRVRDINLQSDECV